MYKHITTLPVTVSMNDRIHSLEHPNPALFRSMILRNQQTMEMKPNPGTFAAP
ncbi:MAG: hypothetical protein HRU40_10765 [Saprospiraceae bacterium]|nr:hypothetical protein [Saprospiraceae bacterium]